MATLRRNGGGARGDRAATVATIGWLHQTCPLSSSQGCCLLAQDPHRVDHHRCNRCADNGREVSGERIVRLLILGGRPGGQLGGRHFGDAASSTHLRRRAAGPAWVRSTRRGVCQASSVVIRWRQRLATQAVSAHGHRRPEWNVHTHATSYRARARCCREGGATTAAAMAVVTGTASTRPIPEAKVLVISAAMSSVDRRSRTGRS